ncbi:MAG TPA: sigma-70 family RNA polymerase sigma factor [Chitinophagales bacterium]|nr:sigma-70 family RNA polymerase sigma factor [Chitinophagales bacterium]
MSRAETYKNVSDEELVQRYRNSHETAYIGELYQRYTHLVFGVCLKYLKNDVRAEDATMQIFEKLITELKKHHVTSFKPWLHTVAKNHCMMEFRKDSSEEKHKTAFKADVGEVVENPEENHLIEEEEKEFVLKYLEEGIHELKDEQRLCIELFYLKENSYAVISAETGFSMNEVKSYIQNGKRNLKNYITAKNEQAKNGQNENK